MSGAKEYSFQIADLDTAGIEYAEYVGTARGYEGALLKVKVYVKDHNLEEIEIIESKEDGYTYMASGLILS